MAEKIIITFNDEGKPNMTFDRKYRKGFPKVRHEHAFTIVTDEMGDEYHVQSSSIKSIEVYN